MSATTITSPSSAALRAALRDAEPVARVARAEVATLERSERAAALKGTDALGAHRDQVAAQRQEADRLDHVVADLREQLAAAVAREDAERLDALAARHGPARERLAAAREAHSFAQAQLPALAEAIRQAQYDLAQIEAPLRAAVRIA